MTDSSKVLETIESTGLKRDAVGTPGVTFTSIANQSPGSAVAFNFSFAILFAGSALPLSLVFALIATLVLANTVVQFSRHLNSARGFGLWVSKGLGLRMGLVTSWTAAFYGLLFPAETVVIMSGVLEKVLKPIGIGVPWWVYDIVLLIFVFAVAYHGVRDSARVAIIFGTFEIAIFLVLGVLLVTRHETHNTFAVFTPTTGLFGVTWGLIAGFLSFSGFESVASLGEEAKNPHRTIGRSAFLAVLGVGGFLIFLVYAGVVGWGGIKGVNGASAAFAADSFPYGTLAARIWPPLQWLVIFAVVTSTLAVCLASMNFASRYVYSLSREGVLPKALSAVHTRHRTPSRALILTFVLSLLLSLVLGGLWGTSLAFAFLATAFTFGWIFMFAFANTALPFYYRRHHPTEYRRWKHLILPTLGTLLLIPAFVAPLLPLLSPFSAAGPIAPQLIATIPIVLAWISIGVVLAFRRYPTKGQQSDVAAPDADVVPVS